jgi:uracil phosphoribosyltransferase
MLCYDALLQKGIPEHTHIVSLIGSAQGVAAVADHMGDRATLWIGAIDEEMNAKSYIVPGLGDAGDLAFGGKDN